MKTMLLAVGGNSLIRAGEKGTIAEQLANAQRTAAQIVALIRQGYRIVVTHGNGPQVGAALLRSERGASQVPGHPLDVCDASTQGEIGYLLQQSWKTNWKQAGLHVPVVTVLTQSLVSLDDPAMNHPSKPIGPFYSRAEAEERRRCLRLGDRGRCVARLSAHRALARSRSRSWRPMSSTTWSSWACW